MKVHPGTTHGRAAWPAPGRFIDTINHLPFRLDEPIRLNALPVTFTLRTDRTHALAFLFLAVAFDVAAFALAFMALEEKTGPMNPWPVLVGPVFGLAALLAALRMWLHREVVRIGECGVTFEEQGLFWTRRWSEPLEAFTVVLNKDGTGLREEEGRMEVLTIQLQHRDRSRSIHLLATSDLCQARWFWQETSRLLGRPALI